MYPIHSALAIRISRRIVFENVYARGARPRAQRARLAATLVRGLLLVPAAIPGALAMDCCSDFCPSFARQKLKYASSTARLNVLPSSRSSRSGVDSADGSMKARSPTRTLPGRSTRA